MSRFGQRVWMPWAFIALLCVACGVLAVVQNRWLAELGDAERSRLHRDLQERLDQFRNQFDIEIDGAVYALIPDPKKVRDMGLEKAFAGKSAVWGRNPTNYFSRIVLALPEDGQIRLINATAPLPEPPPAEWAGALERLRARAHGDEFGPPRSSNSNLIEIPIFSLGDSRSEPAGWLLLQLDPEYLGHNTIPGLVARYLDEGADLRLGVEVASIRDPNTIIYRSGGDQAVKREPDASVNLLDVRDRREFGLFGRPPDRRAPGRERVRPAPPYLDGRGPTPPGPPGTALGRWRLNVWYMPGALESVIGRVRGGNAAISGGLLVLILAAGVALVRYSRNAQMLAQQQFNFVAGVSHELRTPVTIIRTAAYNLRSKVISRPEQVAHYSALIEEESEKLSALVKQVLLFATSGSGNLVRRREDVSVDDLIAQSIKASSVMHPPELVIEKHVEPGLPPISVDAAAMHQALNNLLANAMKYGTISGSAESNWVGISAAALPETESSIEIRVADRGPGIPADEQKHVFEPFFRGDGPIRNQVHGSGLGLSLVRSIVEAHGGSVSVMSEPMRGAEFIVRLPIRSPI